MTNSAPKSLFWNRVQIVAILVVFAAPIVAAFLYKPSSFNNYGDIYTPVRVVDSLSLTASDGTQHEFDDFRRKWILLVTATGECSKACEDNILKIRQLRFMQNNDMTRIRSVFLHSGLDAARAADLAAKYAPVEAYRVDPQAFTQWSSILPLDNVPEEAQIDRFYIVDPAGNLMMSYPAGSDPSNIKKDLKRLLKASQIG